MGKKKKQNWVEDWWKKDYIDNSFPEIAKNRILWKPADVRSIAGFTTCQP